MKRFWLLTVIVVALIFPVLGWAEITQDVWITNKYDYGSDYGVDNEWLQCGGWADVYRFLIKPDLTGLPTKAAKATLRLHCVPRTEFADGDVSIPVGMDLYQVTSAWDEDTGWYNQPSATILRLGLPAPVINNEYDVDVTGWYNQVQAGTIENYGLEFSPISTYNQFSVFASSDYWDLDLRPGVVVEEEIPERMFTLLFPLPGKSPYTARVTAVFDNDPRKEIVRAYDGEVGSANPLPYDPNKPDEVVGYQKEDGSGFSVPLLTGYDDQASGTGYLYLFYDNHTGYDYSAPKGTPILAAADGYLAIATSKTKPPRREDGLWRNNKVCKLPDGVTGGEWGKYHAFFIIHQRHYSTWYLHAKDLEPNIKLQIVLQGYAEVSKGQVVAHVGDKGAKGHPHLHFGVRKKVKGVYALMDPYGSGHPDTSTVDILWEELPSN